MKRRVFLSNLGMGLVGISCLPGFAKQPHWRRLGRSPNTKAFLGKARNLIMIVMDGGPSHVDTFDLKLGSYSPNLLGAETLANQLLWPSGVMPRLAKLNQHFSLVRSIMAEEAVHSRAVYHLLTAHRQNSALVREIPHFASMLSLKLESQRQADDTLPTTIIIGEDPAGNGFLPISHRGLQMSSSGAIPNLEHYYYYGEQRIELLGDLLGEQTYQQDKRGEWIHFQQKGLAMMADSELKQILAQDDGQQTENEFLSQCRSAAKLIAANKGTRVIQLTQFGWDHHDNIYDVNGTDGLPGLAGQFDEGLAFLIEDLAGRPAIGEPGSLLDQTLIVAMGEFGRTVGPLNSSLGRDHFPNVVPALFAGGGTKGGRIIGSTSQDESFVLDRGWSQNRIMTIGDVLASIYGAFGLDWHERFLDTPSGRVFEMVDSIQTGPSYQIDSLFN